MHTQGDNDMQVVCRCSKLIMALVLRISGDQSLTIDFFPDAKHASVVSKSTFTDIVGEIACSHT